MIEFKGQIRRGDEEGEFLYNLVKQPDVHTIVDIGTWKGMGSTKCILDGIMHSHKQNYDVYSIECNKIFYDEARRNLGPLPPNFNLIHGALFSAKELYPIRDTLKGVHLKWINEDISGMQSCQNIANTIPKIIDLIVIDGGEFSGEIEFKLFWKRSKYIYLDDIISYKNEKNRKFILNNPDKFEVLYENLKNNTLICKNILSFPVEMKKTVFLDIDGCILKHHGTLYTETDHNTELLPNVLYKLAGWERKGYKLILTTGRKESMRKKTEKQLNSVGIYYDQLIMGLNMGERVLINDNKPGYELSTASAIQIERNEGIGSINI